VGTPTVRLPLFPLGLVLFPGMVLPLHVFEDRYRRLVRDLLTRPPEDRELGVVAIREGHEVGADAVRALHGTGCVARLRRVEPYDDGRFDIVTRGVRPFRTLRLVDAAPYLQADVELLDDTDDTGDAGDGDSGSAVEHLSRTVAAAFDTYRTTLGAQHSEPADDATALGYLVAATMVLDLADKQRLLEAPGTAARLALELVLLRRESAFLDQLPSLPAVELTRVPASPN
jgi:Lon protease-like protein